MAAAERASVVLKPHHRAAFERVLNGERAHPMADKMRASLDAPGSRGRLACTWDNVVAARAYQRLCRVLLQTGHEFGGPREPKELFDGPAFHAFCAAKKPAESAGAARAPSAVPQHLAALIRASAATVPKDRFLSTPSPPPPTLRASPAASKNGGGGNPRKAILTMKVKIDEKRHGMVSVYPGDDAKSLAAQFCEEHGLADTLPTLPNCGWHGIIERDIAFKLERSPAYAASASPPAPSRASPPHGLTPVGVMHACRIPRWSAWRPPRGPRPLRRVRVGGEGYDDDDGVLPPPLLARV